MKMTEEKKYPINKIGQRGKVSIIPLFSLRGGGVIYKSSPLTNSDGFTIWHSYGPGLWRLNEGVCDFFTIEFVAASTKVCSERSWASRDRGRRSFSGTINPLRLALLLYVLARYSCSTFTWCHSRNLLFHVITCNSEEQAIQLICPDIGLLQLIYSLLNEVLIIG